MRPKGACAVPAAELRSFVRYSNFPDNSYFDLTRSVRLEYTFNTKCLSAARQLQSLFDSLRTEFALAALLTLCPLFLHIFRCHFYLFLLFFSYFLLYLFIFTFFCSWRPSGARLRLRNGHFLCYNTRVGRGLGLCKD